MNANTVGLFLHAIFKEFLEKLDNISDDNSFEDVFNTARYENVEKRALDNDNKVHFKITSWDQKEHSTHVPPRRGRRQR